eukprot:7821969-Prorocentrum_lima.AAC.1
MKVWTVSEVASSSCRPSCLPGANSVDSQDSGTPLSRAVLCTSSSLNHTSSAAPAWQITCMVGGLLPGSRTCMGWGVA